MDIIKNFLKVSASYGPPTPYSYEFRYIQNTQSPLEHYSDFIGKLKDATENN